MEKLALGIAIGVGLTNLYSWVVHRRDRQRVDARASACRRIIETLQVRRARESGQPILTPATPQDQEACVELLRQGILQWTGAGYVLTEA